MSKQIQTITAIVVSTPITYALVCAFEIARRKISEGRRKDRDWLVSRIETEIRREIKKR